MTVVIETKIKLNIQKHKYKVKIHYFPPSVTLSHIEETIYSIPMYRAMWIIYFKHRIMFIGKSTSTGNYILTWVKSFDLIKL